MLSNWRSLVVRQCYKSSTTMPNRYKARSEGRSQNESHSSSGQWNTADQWYDQNQNAYNYYQQAQQYPPPFQFDANWQMNGQAQYWNGGWYGGSYPAYGNYAGEASGPSRYTPSGWDNGMGQDQRGNMRSGPAWNGGYQKRDFHSNSYQPKRYEGNPRHLSTPLSGRSSRHQSDSEISNHREKRDVSRSIPKAPRKHYLHQTLKEPETYPLDKAVPKPLPLLVLDLNGTLVYRGTRSSGSTAERSQNPILRPYLSSFLQYCLAVDAENVSDFPSRQEEWKNWQEDRKKSDKSDDKKTTHGTHFWTMEEQEPQLLESATFRLLLWSSAQPQNVDHMARAILNPSQAEQLLRVYARDTLVRRKFYSLKSPSVKDLEILWAALNNYGNDSIERAEKRLFADAREMEDKNSIENEEMLEQLHSLWHDKVTLPKFDSESQSYSDGNGYGPHNTLLLDDSIDKARLQPFNHLLVPDFDGERAKVAKAFSQANGQGDAQEPEDVLLQVIGVLEHARYQTNVSSWIRFGGLGDLGGMRDQHPFSEAIRSSHEDEPAIKKAWDDYFSQAIPTSSPNERQVPLLNIRVQDRTPSFWSDEGRAALLRKGIQPNL